MGVGLCGVGGGAVWGWGWGCVGLIDWVKVRLICTSITGVCAQLITTDPW